ncbi:MAG: hypothetical protein QM727_09285 [Niabella sp.]
MKRNPQITVIMLMALFLGACSPKLKMTGTWNIDRYETTVNGQQKLTLTNIGTITFKKKGEGDKNLHYTVYGTSKTDSLPFAWYRTGNFIAIESSGSDLSKTWVIRSFKKKEQKWKSAAGTNSVQTLDISRH